MQAQPPTTPATTYTLSEKLLQAIVNALGDMPARITRPLLNAIEAECVQQDSLRQAAAPPLAGSAE